MKNGTITEPMYVSNAGMVLYTPFLPRLFSMLLLAEDHRFKTKNARYKAAYCMQYAVFGKIDFPEHELVLNKLLVGLSINEPLPSGIELTEKEKEIILSMIDGVKNNWEKLRNTSTETLKLAFIQRNGKLEEREDHYLITVDQKPYDMLLDSLPWNFRTIKFPWMEKRMHVNWR